jgi:hypothetical protein
MSKTSKSDDHDAIVSDAQAPGAETTVGVDLARGSDQTVETTFVAGEIVDVRRIPRNPDHCIVVRPDFGAQRAYCSIDRGSHQVEEPFRVNGKITEEEQAAAGEDQTALLTTFAKKIADVVTTEALQRDIEVARVPNSEAGQATAAALREAGFTVVEFAE